MSDEYSYEMEMHVRWRDFDALGHVNHAVYASYCEHIRLKYLEDVLGITLDEIASGERGFSLVLANLNVDYRYPLTEPDTVDVRMCVSDLGSSSVVMEYEISGEGQIAATVETTMVAIDPETGSSMPLPAEWVEAIEEFEGREFNRD